jgi:hypothetical protein
MIAEIASASEAKTLQRGCSAKVNRSGETTNTRLPAAKAVVFLHGALRETFARPIGAVLSDADRQRVHRQQDNG